MVLTNNMKHLEKAIRAGIGFMIALDGETLRIITFIGRCEPIFQQTGKLDASVADQLEAAARAALRIVEERENE